MRNEQRSILLERTACRNQAHRRKGIAASKREASRAVPNSCSRIMHRNGAHEVSCWAENPRWLLPTVGYWACRSRRANDAPILIGPGRNTAQMPYCAVPSMFAEEDGAPPHNMRSDPAAYQVRHRRAFGRWLFIHDACLPARLRGLTSRYRRVISCASTCAIARVMCTSAVPRAVRAAAIARCNNCQEQCEQVAVRKDFFPDAWVLDDNTTHWDSLASWIRASSPLCEQFEYGFLHPAPCYTDLHKGRRDGEADAAADRALSCCLFALSSACASAGRGSAPRPLIL